MNPSHTANQNASFNTYGPYYAPGSPGSFGGNYMMDGKQQYFTTSGGPPSSHTESSGEPSGSSSSSGSSSGGPHRYHGYDDGNYRRGNGGFDPCDLAPPPDDPEALQLAANLSQSQKNILAHVMQALGPKTVWEGLLAKKRAQAQGGADSEGGGPSSQGHDENGEGTRNGHGPADISMSNNSNTNGNGNGTPNDNTTNNNNFAVSSSS